MQRHQWRNALMARQKELEAEGLNVVWVDAPEHPMGCYLRVCQREISEAFLEAIQDAAGHGVDVLPVVGGSVRGAEPVGTPAKAMVRER
ncbi:hypothetical protein GC175_27575 [bacterium]|nr:hypothetical protein [bacterium]